MNTDPILIPTHHHLHVSTGFAFISLLFIVAVIGLLIYAFKKPRTVETHYHGSGQTFTTGIDYAEHPARPSYYEHPVREQSYRAPPQMPAQPIIIQDNSASNMMTGMMTGMVMSDLMSHNHGGHTTIINEAPAIYDAPVYESPSYDSGFSYDSGPAMDTGGFDLSWDS